MTVPVAGSQASAVQASPSSTESGVPETHIPEALHVSLPLQTFASAQLVPTATGTCVTPLAESQLSAVHGLLSSVMAGAPAAQAPPWQTSLLVHKLPSEQSAPSAFDGLLQKPLAGLQLPTS